jgi:putative ABC transport system permease protein
VYYASVFAGSLVGSILIIGGIGAILLRGLKRASGLTIVKKSPVLRHGIANLYRPGAHAVAILASVGIGVMFTLSVYYLQYSLLDEIRLSAPPDAPNVFMINITDRERAGITELIDNDPGVIHKQALSPAVTAQLTSVNGVLMEDMPLVDGTRRFLNTQFTLTWMDEMPPATELLSGQWWPAKSSEAIVEPLVSVQEFAAEALGLEPGSVVEWSILGRPLVARVANIRRTDAVRFGANNQFILSPGALDKFPTVYFGAIRVKPEAVAPLQARMFEQFPTVTVVNAAEVLEVIQGVIDRTSLAVRFVAGFAIFGGLIVLASSVAGTRYRRMREVAILKTVGATRSTLIRIFSAEFAVIGAAAGLTGAVLGAVLSAILVAEILDAPYRFTWMPVFVATAITTLMTIVAGWLASYGVLSRKPLEILRNIEG